MHSHLVLQSCYPPPDKSFRRRTTTCFCYFFFFSSYFISSIASLRLLKDIATLSLFFMYELPISTFHQLLSPASSYMVLTLLPPICVSYHVSLSYSYLVKLLIFTSLLLNPFRLLLVLFFVLPLPFAFFLNLTVFLSSYNKSSSHHHV